MNPSEIASEENIVYYNDEFEPISEEVRNLIIERVEQATITGIMNIDVREVEQRMQVSIWATDVESQDQFYDEWHSEFYEVSGHENPIEIDIR